MAVSNRLEFIGQRRIAFQRSVQKNVDMKKLEEGYKSFSYEVPIAGLREIATARHWLLKLVWMAFVLVFFALTIFFLSKIATELLKEPITTKVNTDRSV